MSEPSVASRPIERLLFGGLFGRVDIIGINTAVPRPTNITGRLFGIEFNKVLGFLNCPTDVVPEQTGSSRVSRWLNTLADHAAGLDPTSTFGRLRHESIVRKAAAEGDPVPIRKIFGVYAGDPKQLRVLSNMVIFHGGHKPGTPSVEAIDIALPHTDGNQRHALFVYGASELNEDIFNKMAKYEPNQKTKDLALNGLRFSSTSTPAEKTGGENIAATLLAMGANPFAKDGPDVGFFGHPVGLGRSSFFEHCVTEKRVGSIEHKILLEIIAARYPEETARHLEAMRAPETPGANAAKRARPARA